MIRMRNLGDIHGRWVSQSSHALSCQLNVPQGTWQFISIARLLDPWSRPHEVSDDLESFFWVLMYEVVRYRNVTTMDLGELMRQVFDDHSEPDAAGIVRGGDGKLNCVVAGTKISSLLILSLVKTPCHMILEEMRSLFGDLYRHIESGNVFSHLRTNIEEARKLDPRVQDALVKLKTPDVFLAIMEKYLTSEWDIDDDGSIDLTEPQQDPAASRNRRKRKADDSGDEEENWHVRRVGRYPPKSSIRRSAVDGHSTQTSISSSHHNSPFSTSRDMPSSSLISSGSLRSGKDGPLEEQ